MLEVEELKNSLDGTKNNHADEAEKLLGTISGHNKVIIINAITIIVITIIILIIILIVVIKYNDISTMQTEIVQPRIYANR